MPAPAPTPYRAVKETKADSAFFGGYSIRDMRNVIVAAVPGAIHHDAHATAELMAAGANHLPKLLEQLEDARPLLEAFAEIGKFLNQAQDALSADEDVLRLAADRGIDGAEKALKRNLDAQNLSHWNRLEDAPSYARPLLDAYAAADRDCPHP